MNDQALYQATKKLRHDIRKALEEIHSTGTFAAHAVLSHQRFQPIHVEDIGPVTCPLDEATARKLIDKAKLAPYGRGSETFVDQDVRNTWELDAAQFDMGDEWPRRIRKACKWVQTELGITAPVIAEPYKMLIYEKGGMFKAHTE